MTNLLSTCTTRAGNVQHISPQNAGWEYVGFDVWLLKAGESLTLPSDDRERCLVLVAGLASVKAADHFFYRIGQRMSPFERIPAYSVYLPHHTEAKVTAETDLELAVCSAPGFGELPVRLISPQDIGVEHRGKGRNQRLVHNILPDTQPADSLLVVEYIQGKAIQVPGLPISMTQQLKGRKPIWKKPTTTVSIHPRDSAYSESTPPIAVWTNVWQYITAMW